MSFLLIEVMRFVIVFIIGFLIFGCSSKETPLTEVVFPVVASTATPLETPSPEFECANITGIIGTADINFDASTVLYFYEEPGSSHTPAQVLRFYDDEDLKMYSFRAEGERSTIDLIQAAIS